MPQKTRGFIQAGWVNEADLQFNSNFIDHIFELVQEKSNRCNNLLEEKYGALFKDHSVTIHQFSSTLIKRHERFSKTAVGWVLREYSKYDIEFVTGFLESHKNWTTGEVIRNATKYIV